MMHYKHSQSPVMAENGARSGVRLAAPQLDISKRIVPSWSQILWKKVKLHEPTTCKLLCTIKIVSRSVQDAALAEEKVACLLTETYLAM